MSAVLAAAIIGGASQILGGLLGRKRNQQLDQGPDVIFVSGYESHKDNSALFAIVGIVAIVILSIIGFRIFRKT